jgi:hypothetical protein
VGGQNLIGVGSILGGSQNDSFVVATTGSLSGTLNGGAGSNTLDLSALGTANFNLGGTATGIGGGFLNIGTLIGNNTTSTLTGTGTGSTYAIAGANSGSVNDGATTTNFSGVVNLTGGAGADVFQVGNTGSLIGTIAGGGGVNALDLSARATANFGLASASSGNASGITGGYSAVTRWWATAARRSPAPATPRPSPSAVATAAPSPTSRARPPSRASARSPAARPATCSR